LNADDADWSDDRGNLFARGLKKPADETLYPQFRCGGIQSGGKMTKTKF